MSMRWLALLLFLCAPSLAFAAKSKAKKPAAESTHDKALKLYDLGKFADAAKLFTKELADVPPLTKQEQDVRELIVLSLFSASDKEGAKVAYATLLERFPTFKFDPERVFPETIAYFETQSTVATQQIEEPVTPPPAPPQETIVATPASTASVDAPRVVQPAAPPAKVWHWYYLAPLGIGQFLAGSPVRGTLFLVAELAFTTMYAVGYGLLEAQYVTRPDIVLDANKAYAAQAVMMTGFFGLIGALALGIVDGALERGPP